MAQRDVNSVTHLSCDKVIATFDKDNMVPPPEEFYAAGNVPVPNLGGCRVAVGKGGPGKRGAPIENSRRTLGFTHRLSLCR
jgi:hypothetical protein